MNIVKTTKLFGLSEDELLITNEYGYTKEENLLFDHGINVTFFDDMEELEEEKEEFEQWAENRKMEIKAIVETINGRIAIVLH